MKRTRFSSLTILAFASAITLAPQAVLAQAYSYPSFQLPTVSVRDYTAAVAVARGTTAFFQWREGISKDMHFTLDAGIGDPEGRNNSLLAFGAVSLGKQLARANNDQPLDVLLTGGAGLAAGGGAVVFRIPVGVSVGHRFDLGDGMAITPYSHPRVSLDLCNSCGVKNNNQSELSINFDLGVNFEVTPRFAIRMAGSLSGSDLLGNNDSFAVGINWIPVPLSSRK